MACILLIDDDLDLLETLEKAVQILGHQALVAGSCQDGVQIALEHVPDLIFTDLTFSDQDGCQVIRSLRATPKTAHIPILVHTAREEHEVREQITAAGATGFISKPVRLEVLRELAVKYSAATISPVPTAKE